VTSREFTYETMIFNAIDRLGVDFIGNLVEDLTYKECLDIFVKMFGWTSEEVKYLQKHFNIGESE
jgi:hypothetical protein